MSISKGIEALRSAMESMGVTVDIYDSEVDVADPAVFAGRCEAFKSIVDERARQEEKFPGQQVPLSNLPANVARRWAHLSRDHCDAASRMDRLSSDDIFAEEADEFREALALGDREAIIKEGVQVMAVVLRIFESDAFKALEDK